MDRATVRTKYGKINTFIYFNYRRKLKFDELETVFSVLFLLAFTQLQDASSIFSIPVESWNTKLNYNLIICRFKI